MLRIPSISQVIQDSFTPDSWISIHTEHQAIKTARDTKELVTINQNLLQAQNKQASLVIDSSKKINGNIIASNVHLSGIKLELMDINSTLISYANKSLAIQGSIHADLKTGFINIHEDLFLVTETLSKIASNQEKEIVVLEKVFITLSKPYETQQKELLAKADNLLKHALRKDDRNQKANLEDSYELFRQVVSNPIGRLDYYAWFEIGWLSWRYRDNLEEAKSAFIQAQRLSDADRNEVFFIKSLRHLAYIYFLLKDFDNAFQTLNEVLLIKPDHVGALYEQVIISEIIGKSDDSKKYFSECLRLNPFKFTCFLVDPRAKDLENFETLIASEMDKQRKHIRVRKIELINTLQKSDKYREYRKNDKHNNVFDYMDKVEEGIKIFGYVWLRQFEDNLIKIKLCLYNENIEFLEGKIKEQKDKLKEIGGKIKNLENARIEVRQNTKNKEESQETVIFSTHRIGRSDPDEAMDELFKNLGCFLYVPLGILFIYIWIKIYPNFDAWWHSPLATLAGFVGFSMFFGDIYRKVYSAVRNKKLNLGHSEMRRVRQNHDKQLANFDNEQNLSINKLNSKKSELLKELKQHEEWLSDYKKSV